MNFFTSDLHFGHRNIIPYCNRPFKDIDDMQAGLITRWNDTVRQEDTVYVLGDFAFCGAEQVELILKNLNGFKVLVLGNHDSKWTVTKWLRLGFNVCNGWSDKVQIPSDGAILADLSHFPFAKSYEDEMKRNFEHHQIDDSGQWLLHGHVHCTYKTKGRMINVGVDVWDYKPVSEKEIYSIINASKPRGDQ